MFKKTLLLFISVFFYATHTLAGTQFYNPGFSCDDITEKDKVEWMICTNEELAGLDRELNEVYQTVFSKIPDDHTAALYRFKGNQKYWLGLRNACASIKNCQALYKDRIALLESYTALPFAKMWVKIGMFSRKHLTQKFNDMYQEPNNLAWMQVKRDIYPSGSCCGNRNSRPDIRKSPTRGVWELVEIVNGTKNIHYYSLQDMLGIEIGDKQYLNAKDMFPRSTHGFLFDCPVSPEFRFPKNVSFGVFNVDRYTLDHFLNTEEFDYMNPDIGSPIRYDTYQEIERRRVLVYDDRFDVNVVSGNCIGDKGLLRFYPFIVNGQRAYYPFNRMILVFQYVFGENSYFDKAYFE